MNSIVYHFHYICICIYSFSRHFYPKRLIEAVKLTVRQQYASTLTPLSLIQCSRERESVNITGLAL